MDNDLTSQIYTEYFNIIYLYLHELFNTIYKLDKPISMIIYIECF